MDLACARVHISGLVQGVFFRANTREQAVSRNLVGWVKNTSDGKVEALFEGAKDAVEDMISWCHKGPSSSRVEEVEVKWERPSGEHTSFKITY